MQLVPRLRMTEATPPVPHVPSWRKQTHLYYGRPVVLLCPFSYIILRTLDVLGKNIMPLEVTLPTSFTPQFLKGTAPKSADCGARPTTPFNNEYWGFIPWLKRPGHEMLRAASSISHTSSPCSGRLRAEKT